MIYLDYWIYFFFKQMCTSNLLFYIIYHWAKSIVQKEAVQERNQIHLTLSKDHNNDCYSKVFLNHHIT